MEYKEALHRASALCSQKEQSGKQIREKLSFWNVSETDIDGIMKELYRENFLDDRRYAGFFTKDKFAFNGWGKIKIAYHLRQKEIGEHFIQEALEQIDQEVYFQTCLNLLQKKSGSIKDKNHYSRKGKLFRFASGRGFEPDLIHRVLNQIEKE